MKKLWAIITWISGVFAGMMGGQGKVGGKSARRFGLPFLSFGLAVENDGFQWKDLSFLILIPLLSIGYGENSQLMQWIGNETAVRAVYALLLTIPFMFYGLIRWMVSACCLVLAFQVRAGSLGNMFGFDILIEDIIRYGVLMGLVIFNVIFKNSIRRA